MRSSPAGICRSRRRSGRRRDSPEPPMMRTSRRSAERSNENTSSEAERRGLRQQPAGDAGETRPECIDRDQAAIDRNADRGGAQWIALERAQRQAKRRIDDPPRHRQTDEQHDQAVDVAGVAIHIEARTGPRTGAISTPCRPSAPPVRLEKRLAISPSISETPSVTMSRVRSEPRNTRKLVTKPSAAATQAGTDKRDDRLVDEAVFGDQAGEISGRDRKTPPGRAR